MKIVERLTAEQESRIPEWAEKWTKIGLSTEPADFDKAIAAAEKTYSLCGLSQPRIVLKVGSPYAATIGGAMAYEVLKYDYISAHNVNSQGWDGGMSQSWDDGMSQLSNKIRGLVSSQISTQITSQINNQVYSQVISRVFRPIHSQVYDRIHGQISDQLRSPLRDRVRSQVSNTVWDKIINQVNSQVRNQVWDQVWERISIQVRDRISDGIRDHVWRHIRSNGVPLTNEGISSLLCSYISYFTFFRDVCGLELSPDTMRRISINEDLVTSCGGTWWHENILVISDRPKKINLDAEGRLHCENGPSIEYRDGWSLYHWHGVYIPEEWMTTKKPTPKEALTWKSIEQRRAACEIVGWANVLKELDAKIINEDGDPEIGTLVECNIPDSGRERFLRVLCGTSREFVIPVPRKMKTAIEANSWTWGLSSNEYKPEVRT